MMIDASEQGRGYGRAALGEVLSYIRTKPFGDSDRVTLTCGKDNDRAIQLYQKMGFRPTGIMDEDEAEYVITLSA